MSRDAVAGAGVDPGADGAAGQEAAGEVVAGEAVAGDAADDRVALQSRLGITLPEEASTFPKRTAMKRVRVSWPSRREVYATTVVVILTSIFFGLYLWLVDMGLNRVVSWLFRTLGA